MSTPQRPRAFGQGRAKTLQPIKPPLTPPRAVSALPPPRNPVARALSARASGAGRHIRSQGAQRRADRMALRQLTASALTDL